MLWAVCVCVCVPVYVIVYSECGVARGGGTDIVVCPLAGVFGRDLSSKQLLGSIPVELGRLTTLMTLCVPLLFCLWCGRMWWLLCV